MKKHLHFLLQKILHLNDHVSYIQLTMHYSFFLFGIGYWKCFFIDYTPHQLMNLICYHVMAAHLFDDTLTTPVQSCSPTPTRTIGKNLKRVQQLCYLEKMQRGTFNIS
mmetsp:Transcript_30326/g.63953  ORF Transcript_30326/g.63953 Transcript_30326/m.63953 type:complete len:108 (-) Transcript_30326:193-516(-)